MATRRQTNYKQVTLKSERSTSTLHCRLAHLALLSSSLMRETHIPPELETSEQLHAGVRTSCTVSPLEEEPDLYYTHAHLSVSLNMDGKHLLTINLEYEADMEVTCAKGEVTVSRLQDRAIDLLRPYASQLVADLVTRAGLPPYFLPPSTNMYQRPEDPPTLQ